MKISHIALSLVLGAFSMAAVAANDVDTATTKTTETVKHHMHGKKHHDGKDKAVKTETTTTVDKKVSE